MAVENKIVTGNVESVAVDTGVAARFTGNVLKAIPFSFEVAATDSAGSIHRFARISPQAIMVGLELMIDATAGLTEVDIGFYKPLELGGAVIDIDAIVDGANYSAGLAAQTEVFVPAIAEIGFNAWELAGLSAADQVKYGSFDVAFTAVSDVSAAGTIAGVLYYMDGV